MHTGRLSRRPSDAARYRFGLFILFIISYLLSFFFFFNDTATTEIYTLSLHDALPIYVRGARADHVDWPLAPLQGIRPHTHQRGGATTHRLRPAAEPQIHRERRVGVDGRSEEHTSELQSQSNLVCRLLLEKKKKKTKK